MSWDNLSMADRAAYIKLGLDSGITDLKVVRDTYNKYAEGGPPNPYSAGSLVDAIYKNSKGEEYLGKPSHHYDFTISEEEANRLGYYPDERGHRDDRVKKPAHPTHPSRGKWNSFEEFELTDRGMENPNYTLFGLNDGGQDPQAVMTYREGVVLPEITVTPEKSYIHNPYDNTNIYAGGGPSRPRPKAVPKGHSSEIYDDPQWYEEHKEDVEAHKREVAERERKYIERKTREANKAESQFNSYRRATEELSKYVQEPVFKESSLKQAADTQYQKNLNTWQPVLATADLGLNIATMYSSSPALFGASILANGIQLGDNIYNKDDYEGEVASLFFDTIGLLGSTNKLPLLKFRRGNTNYTFNIGKAADYIGAGWNMVDSGNDLYGLGKFGYEYHNTPNPNLIFEPFSR